VQLTNVRDITSDYAGNLYLAGDSCIRKVPRDTQIISVVAGRFGIPGVAGDNGSATSSTVKLDAEGVAVDLSGDIYIATGSGNRVRRVAMPAATISTIAGATTAGNTGDNGVATSARLNNPTRIATDGLGVVDVADTGNSRLRRIK
jgi:hypothetical protein